MKNLITVLQGFVMGIAEIIPGVSGSTFAVVMGIYDDFLNFLHGASDVAKVSLKVILRKSSFKDLRNTIQSWNLRFGVLLVIGMALAVGTLSFIIVELLNRFPQYMSAFFFGLVLASVFIPYKQIKAKNFSTLLAVLISFLLTFILLGINPVLIGETPNTLYLFLCGIVGITGLILPGVSGSFILLMLGVYGYVVSGLKEILSFKISSEKLIQIVVFTLGILTGLIIFVRILKFLLEKYPNTLLAVLVGIMLGSLRAIYPFFEVVNGNNQYQIPFIGIEISMSFLIMVFIFIGFGVVVFLDRISKINQSKELGKIT